MSGPESTESLQYHLRRMADVAADQIDADRLSRAADQIDTRAPVDYAALPEVQALIAGVLELAASMIEDNVRHAKDLGHEIWPMPDLRTLTPADAIAARDAMITAAIRKRREGR